MSELSDNIKRAAAVVDADSFTSGELQRIPFSFSVTHGNGPVYTTKTVPIGELTGQAVDTDGFETLDLVVINQDETKVKRISSDLLKKFHASTDENS